MDTGDSYSERHLEYLQATYMRESNQLFDSGVDASVCDDDVSVCGDALHDVVPQSTMLHGEPLADLYEIMAEQVDLPQNYGVLSQQFQAQTELPQANEQVPHTSGQVPYTNEQVPRPEVCQDGIAEGQQGDKAVAQDQLQAEDEPTWRGYEELGDFWPPERPSSMYLDSTGFSSNSSGNYVEMASIQT